MLLVSNLPEGYSGFLFQCYSHLKDFGGPMCLIRLHQKMLRPSDQVLSADHPAPDPPARPNCSKPDPPDRPGRVPQCHSGQQSRFVPVLGSLVGREGVRFAGRILVLEEAAKGKANADQGGTALSPVAYAEAVRTFQRRQPAQPANPKKQPPKSTSVLGSGPGANVPTVETAPLIRDVEPATNVLAWVLITYTSVVTPLPISLGRGKLKPTTELSLERSAVEGALVPVRKPAGAPPVR